MDVSKINPGDRLFFKAEELARDFSLFPHTQAPDSAARVEGLLQPVDIERQLKLLADLDVDSYIDRYVTPAAAPDRPSAKTIMEALADNSSEVVSDGPYYSAIIELQFKVGPRKIGLIAQNRVVQNGVWMPEHHLMAAKTADSFARRSLPILTLMDTPGADAKEEANQNNQSHAISRLIAQMCNAKVPTIGVIFGLGYSGGAIPLAASNMILSVRDGVFNTIQPQGLASIARKYNLSWQECAKHVGVSAYELYKQGNVDGVIDYVPGETGKQLENFRQALVTGFEVIEQSLVEFTRDNDDIMDYYREGTHRYLARHASQINADEEITETLTDSHLPPAEYPNVFGVVARYLRYLSLRRRIQSTSMNQYGRLAEQEIPVGELHARTEQEMRVYFDVWLQNPDKLIYEDSLIRAVRNYNNKKESMELERGSLAQFFLGEPKKNYEAARLQLLVEFSLYLYNRWKNKAHDNLRLLINHLQNVEETSYYIKVDDILRPQIILKLLTKSSEPYYIYLREHMSHEGNKLLRAWQSKMPETTARTRLATELNWMMREGILAGRGFADAVKTKVMDRRQRNSPAHNRSIPHSRWLLAEVFPGMVRKYLGQDQKIPDADLTLLDVIQHSDLRADFVLTCQKLLTFGSIYDEVLNNLSRIAREADQTNTLSAPSLASLLDLAYKNVSASHPELLAGFSQTAIAEMTKEETQTSIKLLFRDWLSNFAHASRQADFLKAVEEWKKASFPHLSDTLFVIVTFLFEKLIPDYFASQNSKKRYAGKIRPKRIGQRKDFWNRLTIAYRDMQIQSLLQLQKQRQPIRPQHFIDKFFVDYEEINADLLSSDPVDFPGFRLAIESALKKSVPPCGVCTGIGYFKRLKGKKPIKVGVLLSNVAFQAGAFDMASAEKFCRLLVTCAQQRLPVICFISSGGMQTKEGAGALFSMAVVNDRLTCFISDLDLPVIIFGFGDCAGGAQASFVTHPLAHTYYLSGANIPFAGQIVVPSNLPFTSTLANYLARIPGSMQGLVKHPFLLEQDEELLRIDPQMPLPEVTIQEVVTDITTSRYRIPDSLALPGDSQLKAAEPSALVDRTLIHARGCTAVKLIRVAQKKGIEVVLVQSDPDMDSVAVDMLAQNDRVICIGGSTPDESYLNGRSVVKIAENEGVNALHPGIGFLSENSQFAELCRNHGINFIGPPVASMEAMGNKSNAINTALRLSVPVVPGSYGVLHSEESAVELAEKIGFPLLIKAVHGGGGKGIQLVDRIEDFVELFYQVKAEAKSAFGNGDVYLEKYIISLRHIEVQLLRDAEGNTLILGLRDCSVQRSKQKIVEESGATALSKKLEKSVYGYSRAIADEIGYLGVGTVEFIHDLKEDAVYFMEMNARLQVEHPVTEAVSGVDLVGAQFDIASGKSIAGLKPNEQGYAIEVRINAERINLQADGTVVFRPAPGRMQECVFPEADDIEVIAAVAADKTISPFYDSMIGQVIAHGKDRKSTAKQLHQYIQQIDIKGIPTNIPVLKRILTDKVFLAGKYDTAYLDGLMERIKIKDLLIEIEASAGTHDLISQKVLKIKDSDELKVLAPASGIIYLTASPTEPPYVTEGDVVNVNKTICQIEAMKMFTSVSLSSFNQSGANLYPPDQQYKISRVQYTSGNQVNAGDLLFVIAPVVEEAQD